MQDNSARYVSRLRSHLVIASSGWFAFRMPASRTEKRVVEIVDLAAACNLSPLGTVMIACACVRRFLVKRPQSRTVELTSVRRSIAIALAREYGIGSMRSRSSS